MLSVAVPAAAQSYPGTPAKTGQASVTYGGKNLAFTTVEGGFQSVQGGFTIATLVFKQGPEGRPHAPEPDADVPGAGQGGPGRRLQHE